jgi:cysteinyl-tRNA synthetase
MASDILDRLVGAKTMDIHSGGEDLKFPHHDNEMAQAEAECGEKQWVNYFIHAGHLHIKGLKMSKSLKNFITIQQALELNSARQIRLLFLLHKYNAPMDYGDNTMIHAVQTEKTFVEFFHNVKACLRQYTMEMSQKWEAKSVALQRTLADATRKVDAALKDDFDTPTVLAVLVDLVKATNVYMEGDSVVGLVVRNVSSYITQIFKVFGLIHDDAVGFTKTAGGASREEVLAPVLDALMTFRSSVRDKARQKDISGVLQECDGFRDTNLPPLGIRLEDKADGSVWKLADPAELIQEMLQREAEAERKAEEKALKAIDEAKKESLNRMSPEDYMKQLVLEDGTTLMYSQFDVETGMPTHDNKGEPLNKSQGKKVQKMYKAQQQKYEKYLQAQG